MSKEKKKHFKMSRSTKRFVFFLGYIINVRRKSLTAITQESLNKSRRQYPIIILGSY